MRRNAIGTLAVALAIAAGGCGSADQPLTRAEFTTKVLAICKQRRAETNAAERSQRTFLAGIRKAYPIQRREHDALAALKPPANLRPKYERMLAIDAMQMRRAAEAIEGHPRPISGNDAAIGHEQGRLKQELGLAACV